MALNDPLSSYWSKSNFNYDSNFGSLLPFNLNFLEGSQMCACNDSQKNHQAPGLFNWMSSSSFEHHASYQLVSTRWWHLQNVKYMTNDCSPAWGPWHENKMQQYDHRMLLSSFQNEGFSSHLLPTVWPEPNVKPYLCLQEYLDLFSFWKF